MNKLCECGCGKPTAISKVTRSTRGVRAGQRMRFILGHNTGRGTDNPFWKGDSVSYVQFHRRVRTARGKPKECEWCGSKEWLEWANMTGSLADPNDYRSLCVKCHRNFDRGPEEKARILKLMCAGRDAYYQKRRSENKGCKVRKP